MPDIYLIARVVPIVTCGNIGNLTNYEELLGLINRGPTADGGYRILRDRVNAVVLATYPQFAPSKTSEELAT